MPSPDPDSPTLTDYQATGGGLDSRYLTPFLRSLLSGNQKLARPDFWLEKVTSGTRRVPWVESLAVPDDDDVVRLLQWARESAQFHRRHLRDSFSAEPGDAIRDDDEEQPGKHKIIFRTKEGEET